MSAQLPDPGRPILGPDAAAVGAITREHWARLIGQQHAMPDVPAMTCHRWLPGDDLRTRPPEHWVGLIHDATWEGEK